MLLLGLVRAGIRGRGTRPLRQRAAAAVTAVTAGSLSQSSRALLSSTSGTVTVYNSLTRAKEPLVTQRDGVVEWYQCGPTVYDDSHLGHAVCYMRFDIIRRALEDYLGYHVNMVLGITDVDDKIINRARSENTSWEAVSRKYEKRFFEDCAALSIRPPSHVTRVSEHIPDITQFVQGIVDRGHAYATDDGMYFDIAQFGAQNYWKLGEGKPSADSKREPLMPASNVVDFGEGTPSCAISRKRSLQDFALWKRSRTQTTDRNSGDWSDGQDRDTAFASAAEATWPSPFGEGRPGWHIECSAMASSLFGSRMDIHTGGKDLLYPHHTNELAQSESFHGVDSWVSCFMHGGHLFLADSADKMSKSLKNTISIRDFLANYASEQELRLFCLQSRYRSDLRFSLAGLDGAKSLLKRFTAFVQHADSIYNESLRASGKDRHVSPGGLSFKPTENCKRLLARSADFEREFRSAILDDFDTPRIIRAASVFVKEANTLVNAGAVSPFPVYQAAHRLRWHLACLGLSLEGSNAKSLLQYGTAPDEQQQQQQQQLESVLDIVRELRNTVRATASRTDDKETRQSLFQACDAARDQLSDLGFDVADKQATAASRRAPK